MSYAATTIAALAQSVANQLADASMTFWSPLELQRYVVEACRTWQAYTRAYRVRLEFTSALDTPFYDLTTVSPTAEAALAFSVTDRDLVTDLQYNLIEPPTGTSWTGSPQFTQASVVGTLQNRRDAWLAAAGLVVTRVIVNVSGQPVGRIPLPANTLDVRRVAWLPVDGGVVPLNREDEWGLNSFAARLWPITSRQPKAYSVAVTPQPSLQLAPNPIDTGQLDLVLVTAGAPLDPGVGVVLGMPDDWTWMVRLGALADLLNRDGLARDVPRAGYAQQRWQDGLEIVKRSATILNAAIDSVPVRMVALADADRFRLAWQQTASTPTAVAIAGQTYVALVPTADWGPAGPTDTGYGVTLDVVARWPVPTDVGAYIELAPDALTAITDYAAHLAMFKVGGAPFVATQGLLQSFYERVGLQDARAKAVAAFQPPLESQTRRDEQVRARTVTEAVA